jgi:Protein of unknown function (DUF1569)
MDPHLGRLEQAIADAISGFDPQLLNWHEPGKWSTAEILEHLYLTYTGTIKGCRRLLEKGHPLTSRATLKHLAQSFIVVGLGYMPTGRKSPEVARPRGLAANKISSEIAVKIREMDAVLTQCAAIFGTRVKVLDHPVLGPFSIAQWRKFHLVHGLHHFKQIRRLREEVTTLNLQGDPVQK